MRQLRGLVYSALLLGISAAFPALAQEQLTPNRSTEMRSAPDDTASIVKQLAEKMPLQLLERRGAWSRVKSGNDSGWVRMMHLRGGATVVEASPSSGGGFLASFTRLLSGDGSRSGGQRAQSATVGIRGFSKEDLAKAEFNPAEFEKLKRYQTTEAEARRYASGKLAFRSLAYRSDDAIESAKLNGAKK